MRDVEQMREKMEIALDGKQVAALAVCALLLLAGVFALGLVMGKRLGAPAAGSGDPLAVLDEAHAEEVAAVAPSKPTPAPVTPKADPPPAEPAKAEPPVALAQKDDEPAEQHEEPRGRTPTHATTVPAPPPPRPTIVPAPPEKPTRVTTIQPVVLNPPPRDLGNFTVQIGASQDAAEAQRLEAKARAAGLKPYVVQAHLGDKGDWYRVRVGAFKDKDAASRYRKDVERELRSAAVVMVSH